MAARPQVLCKLEKGKVIDAQSGFVDTFNWMVDFINNLRGEGEEIAGNSDLRVDRTVDDHPVIRGGAKSSGSQHQDKQLVCGPDSNVVFSQSALGSDTLKVDVYYV